jgi:hypothetical protein
MEQLSFVPSAFSIGIEAVYCLVERTVAFLRPERHAIASYSILRSQRGTLVMRLPLGKSLR